MAKMTGFAKAIVGRWRIVEMDIRLRLRKAAEFFNSLLVHFRGFEGWCANRTRTCDSVITNGVHFRLSHRAGATDDRITLPSSVDPSP